MIMHVRKSCKHLIQYLKRSNADVKAKRSYGEEDHDYGIETNLFN